MNLYLCLPFVNLKFKPSQDFSYALGFLFFSFRVYVTGVTAQGTRTGVSWVGRVRYTSRLSCNVATKYGLTSSSRSDSFPPVDINIAVTAQLKKMVLFLKVFEGVANFTGWTLKGPCHTVRNSDAKL
jgi:hypothetical protein